MNNISKWHQVLEAMDQGLVAIKHPVTSRIHLMDREGFPFDHAMFRRGMLAAAEGAHRYVLSDEVLELVDPMKQQHSILDLVHAGITDLPFELMSVEYDYDVNTTNQKTGEVLAHRERTFIVILKVIEEDRIDKDLTHRTFWFSLSRAFYDSNRLCVLVCPMIYDMGVLDYQGQAKGKFYEAYAGWITDKHKFNKMLGIDKLKYDDTNRPWFSEANDINFTMQSCMLLLNTKGINKEEVEAPHKLNKHRAAAVKPGIRNFTYVRIGKVYNKAGEEVNQTGRKMPIHWRAGHTRQQHYGAGNEKTKLVYIRPVLVNYDPAVEFKEKPRLVKA